jgi:hypothetical protein
VHSARWLIDSFQTSAASAMMASAVATAVGIAWVAVRGGERAAKRLAWELVALGSALIAAELLIQATTAGADSDDPLVQRRAAREHAARRQGVDFDARPSWEVVRTLRATGTDALLGIPRSMVGSELVRDRLPRDFYPLGYASNAEIVECNEGRGFLRFRTDEYGFNNPPGLVASRNVEVAVVGESLALGQCVAPDKSAVASIRERYPRTANFGVTGARILSQLAVFREYVEPLRPPVVVWFVNTAFADPKEEAREPLLLRYLDRSFSQDLRHRQPEIDAALRDVIAPLGYASLQRSERAHADAMQRVRRTLRLPNVRRLIAPPQSWRRPGPPAELDHFKTVLQLATRAASSWRGRLVIVVLPSYGDTTGERLSRERYRAVVAALEELSLDGVDGAQLFRDQIDPLGLYMLRISNHPNERGHALLGDAVVKAIASRDNW